MHTPTYPNKWRDAAVVILAKNEAASIVPIIEGALKHVSEVVVVDGRSTDDTAEVSRKNGAKVIVDDGRGKGAGIRLAIREVDKPILVFMDADGSHDPDEIPRFRFAFEANPHAGLVTGSRVKGGSDELHGNLSKFLRIIGSNILTAVIDMRWRVPLTDTQNGFRALRREVGLTLGLREDGFTIEEEMIMETLRRAHPILEVPTHEYERVTGDSHIQLWRVSFRFVWVVIKGVFKRDEAR